MVFDRTAMEGRIRLDSSVHRRVALCHRARDSCAAAAMRFASKIESQPGRQSEGSAALPPTITEGKTDSGFSQIFRPPYLRRTVMLVALNIFQAMGFYGFSNWVPTLLTSQGVGFVKSLQYSFAIAIVYPITPFLCTLIADRIERKVLIIAGALGTAVFGLIFAQQSNPVQLVMFGVL